MDLEAGHPEGLNRHPGFGSWGRRDVDLLARWQITKNLELFTGYAHFFAGHFIQHTPGSDRDANWFFVQSAYKF